MKRVMTLLLVVGLLGLFTTRVFADLQTALGLSKSGTWAQAVTEFQNVIPTLTGADKALAQAFLGHALYNQQMFAEAGVAYQAALDNTDATPTVKASAQLMKGRCLNLQGNYVDGSVELKKVAGIIGARPDQIAFAQFYLAASLNARAQYDAEIVELQAIENIPAVSAENTAQSYIAIGTCLEKQGKKVEAQEYYLKTALDEVSISTLKIAVSKIKPSIIGKDKYVAYLNNIVLIVPAKAENAEFLAYIGSEIEAKSLIK